LQKRIDDPLPIVEDRFEFATALVACSSDVSEGNGLSCQLRGYRRTKKAILVEDTDFSHVTGIVPNGHIFTHVRSENQGKIPQTVKVNAVATDLPSAYRLHEQQIKLLERLGHARQKSTFLPARRGSRPCGGAGLSMVGLKKECPEKLLKLLDLSARNLAVGECGVFS
jgi:hypothetical protein